MHATVSVLDTFPEWYASQPTYTQFVTVSWLCETEQGMDNAGAALEENP